MVKSRSRYQDLVGVHTKSSLSYMCSINTDSNHPDSCQSCDRLTSSFDQLCRGQPTGSDLACCDRYCDRWSSGSLAIITLDLKARYLSHHRPRTWMPKLICKQHYRSACFIKAASPQGRHLLFDDSAQVSRVFLYDSHSLRE